jgi:hypothetical protein
MTNGRRAMAIEPYTARDAKVQTRRRRRYDVKALNMNWHKGTEARSAIIMATSRRP